MNTKVYLLAAVAVLVVAVAAVEGLMIARGPAHHVVNTSPLGEGGPPAPSTVEGSGPGEGLLLHPSPSGEGGPASGPGEGLKPTTSAPALAAEVALSPSGEGGPSGLGEGLGPNNTGIDLAPASSAAAPAELSPEEKAAQKAADYRHALEVLADQQIDQFSKLLDLTADQRQTAAPTFAKLKSVGVNLQITSDQLQHLQNQPAVLAPPPNQQNQQQVLMGQMSSQMADLVNALGELKPILTNQQAPKLDAIITPMTQAQKHIQNAYSTMEGK